MLALFPEEEDVTISNEVLVALPRIVATVAEEKLWVTYIDGSSTTAERGASIMLVNLEGQTTALSFKLSFPCTNNVAEYKALIMSISKAREISTKE
ncbi:hypothetical protein DVH24_040095 [Malus domestica]|uniref:Uncharacterized protein n=1 Tax=Malus domestica TaxID=3750 RepID=A0A498I7H0_MALDO|nr:hypothetical protein DVH24_040095 [Malus domestica]